MAVAKELLLPRVAFVVAVILNIEFSIHLLTSENGASYVCLITLIITFFLEAARHYLYVPKSVLASEEETQAFLNASTKKTLFQHLQMLVAIIGTRPLLINSTFNLIEQHQALSSACLVCLYSASRRA